MVFLFDAKLMTKCPISKQFVLPKFYGSLNAIWITENFGQVVSKRKKALQKFILPGLPHLKEILVN